MKKLIMITIVALTASIVNAASFSWSSSIGCYFYASDLNTAWGSKTVSLYAYEVSSGFDTALKVSESTTTTTGKVKTTYFGDSVEQSNLAGIDFKDSTSYGFYAVIEDGMNTYRSEVIEATAYDSTTTVVLTFSQDYTKTSQQLAATPGAVGWTVVPEPTSGLLLLIGAAGLALRRKRA